MRTRVVCISRTLGSGAEEIGLKVAEQLGFRYVDDEIVERAARMVQVDPQVVAKAEHRQPLVDRILEWISLSSETAVRSAGSATHAPLLVTEDYRAIIRGVVYETAKKGDVVIMAHAASVAAATLRGVLRVLLTASEDTRVKRIAAAQELGTEDALRAVRESDAERAEYFKRFYQIDEEQPTHYDLLISTDVLTPEQAAGAIVAAARA
jgi:cytidylate kinase